MNKEVIHYPRLKTILMVEKILKESETAISREEIKRRLKVGIMHQSLNIILEYLEERGLIIDSHKGVLWIYNPSQKLKNTINKSKELKRLTLNEIKSKIIPILKKNKVVKAGIFGSYARNEQTDKSDIDILIEVKNKKFSLLDLIELEQRLEEILEIKVDLLTYNGINPMLKEIILKEEIRII